jgi:hypothetical protein
MPHDHVRSIWRARRSTGARRCDRSARPSHCVASLERTREHGAVVVAVDELEQSVAGALEHGGSQLAPPRVVGLTVDGVLDPVEQAVVVVLLPPDRLVEVLTLAVLVSPLKRISVAVRYPSLRVKGRSADRPPLPR